MRIENNIIYADFGKALYRASNQSFAGKEYVCHITFFDNTGKRLVLPTRENESYFYELDDLDELKVAKIKELESYDNSDGVNTITVNGVKLIFRASERLKIALLINSLKTAGKEFITLWNGVDSYDMPISTAESVFEQYELYAADVFNTTSKHKAAIMQLSTVEAIRDYNFTSDYPAPLVINIE